MPFATRTRVHRGEVRRSIEHCDYEALRAHAIRSLLDSIEEECIRVALAAAWATGLDAVLEKPYGVGGLWGRRRLNPLRMAAVPGIAWSTAAAACTAGARRGEPWTALLAALGAATLQPGSLAQGALVPLSLVAYTVGRGEEPEAVARIVWEDDGLGAALLYAIITVSQPGYLHRLGYSGLPDATNPCSPLEALEKRVKLGEVLTVAGETSLAYRDLVEGLPRAQSLASNPVTAFWEALRVYAMDSGLLRRRCGSKPADQRLAVIEGCTAGDVIDLGVLASFLSLLDSLDPTLLEGKGYTVEGV